jgi:hypothetical protein
VRWGKRVKPYHRKKVKMATPLLTTEATSDPKVIRALEKLESLPAFSLPFYTLKESLKEYLLDKEGTDRNWVPDWEMEQAIMAWLYGEGHA